MTSHPLIDKICARVELDKQDGDIAYFHALSLYAEYITKLGVCAVEHPGVMI